MEQGKKDTIGQLVSETKYGLLTGAPNDPALQTNGAAMVVVPSEAIDVYALSEDKNALSQRYGGNVIEGSVQSREVVGHTVFYMIALPDGRELNIESHVGKYASAFTEENTGVYVTWNPSEATVITAPARA